MELNCAELNSIFQSSHLYLQPFYISFLLLYTNFFECFFYNILWHFVFHKTSLKKFVFYLSHSMANNNKGTFFIFFLFFSVSSLILLYFFLQGILFYNICLTIEFNFSNLRDITKRILAHYYQSMAVCSRMKAHF